MGLLDRVRCRYPLPDAAAQDLDYQSQSTPAQRLDRYEITPDGRLMHEVDNAPTGRYWEPTDFRGQLEIYAVLERPDEPRRWVCYLLWFRDGRVVDLQPGSGHLTILPSPPTAGKQ